jgi:hypothetical protein
MSIKPLLEQIKRFNSFVANASNTELALLVLYAEGRVKRIVKKELKRRATEGEG